MINFEKVRWKNLLSTGNKFTEIQLDQNHTTLIVGQNGHGKSTMLDALCFALFGRPFRKINKPNLINSINQKDLLVELEFRIGGRKYFIRRGMNPNVFDILIDGVLVKQESVSKDYQKYLESNILKFNMRAFTQIVILGSKSFIPFMKLGPQDRRAIIENLLDIQIFSSMNRIAKEKLNQARESLQDNKKAMEATQSQIELQKQYVEDSKKNVQEQIDKKIEDIKDHEKELALISENKKQIYNQINELMTGIIDRPVVEKKMKSLDDYHTKIESNLVKARKDHKFYHDNDKCPVCLQAINDEFKQKAIQKANTSSTQYNEALKMLDSQKKKYSERMEEIENILKQCGSLNLEINKITVSENHIQEYIRKVKFEIDDLSSKKTLSDDMIKVSEELVNKYETQIITNKNLVESRAYYDISVNLLKDGGIKAQIIKQYLPVINQLVNKYLSSMDFFVNFELNEEFDESIKSRHRDEFTYDNFSEGEKQKIDIALLFAWRAVAKLKNSMNTNLLILDEIFDSSLDGTGADLVLSIIESTSKDSNVFVISHRELLHDKFENTIKFEKKNNFSEIVQIED